MCFLVWFRSVPDDFLRGCIFLFLVDNFNFQFFVWFIIESVGCSIFFFLNLNGGLLFGLYDVVRIDFLLVIRTCSVNSLLPYLLELFHRTAFRPSSISLSLSIILPYSDVSIKKGFVPLKCYCFNLSEM